MCDYIIFFPTLMRKQEEIEIDKKDRPTDTAKNVCYMYLGLNDEEKDKCVS